MTPLRGKSGSYATLLTGCVLGLLTLVVYWQVGNHQFLTFDDGVYVTANPHVANGITLQNIVWAFTSLEAGNWHPLTWLSHMTDVQLFGMNPRGHHLTNLILHILSTLILLILLVRLTGDRWQSAFVATLFALHPLHVESVAWVAERKDVLGGLFWMFTLLAYTEYTKSQKASYYSLSLCCLILGLMAKPMLVTLPFVMLLLDLWPLARCESRKSIGALLREKIPFFICSLLSGLITLYAQKSGGAVGTLSTFPISIRAQNALVSYAAYIGKTLLPLNLAVYYPFPAIIPLWQVAGSLLLLTVISVAVVLTRKRHPYLTVGWFWFIITLLPVIGLIQVGDQAMADRYSYIPQIGLGIMAAWGFSKLTNNLPFRNPVTTLLAITLIVACTFITWMQLGKWQNSISLYRHDLNVTTGNTKIYYNLGLALQAEGDLDGAILNYGEAIRMNPFLADSHNNLGAALQAKGYLVPAIQEYQAALRVNPDYVNAYVNLGSVLHAQGDLDGAINQYRQALLIEPRDIEAQYNLGVVLQAKGDLSTATQAYRDVLRKKPNHMKAHSNLGIILATQGDLDGAIAQFREALSINPSDTTVAENLALAMAQKNKRTGPGK